jgi:hypothetical protein
MKVSGIQMTSLLIKDTTKLTASLQDCRQNPTRSNSDLVEKLRQFVHENTTKSDDAHDINHLLECEELAQEIAKSVGYGNSVLISFAALLHERNDSKLMKLDPAGAESFNLKIAQFCRDNLDGHEAAIIMYATGLISYSKKIKGWHISPQMFRSYLFDLYYVMHIVSDADLILAFRLGRALSFSKTIGESLYTSADLAIIEDVPNFSRAIEMLRVTYVSSSGGSVLGHFLCKLIHIGDMLTFDESRRIGHLARVAMIEEMAEELGEKYGSQLIKCIQTVKKLH